MKGKFDNWILVAMFVKMFALGIAFRNHNKPYVKPNSEILSISKKDWIELAEEILKLFLKNSLFIKKQV